MNKSYYDILDVQVDAPAEQIKEAFLKAKSAYSNDTVMYSLTGIEESQNLLAEVEQAFSILSDPNKRKQYDLAQLTRKKVKPFKANVNPVSTTSEETKKTPLPSYALKFEKNIDFEEKIKNTTHFSGEILKEIREYKNIDLDRMVQLTKLSKKVIISIETETFDRVPVQAYLRSFSYQYARAIQLDAELVAKSYIEQFINKE